MNYRTVYDLAIVLTKSQLRGTRGSKFIVRLFQNPRIILAADLLLLAGLGGLGYLIMSRSPIQLREMIAGSEGQALAGIPTAIAFAVIVFGVMYEVTQPIQMLNTDLVNWLPVSPAEYAAGSTISECYLYSIMQCLLLGVLLGPAIYLMTAAEWLAAAVMSSVSLFIGACVVELIDATTNRISSTFYKKSGKSAIVFRLVITIVFLVFIQLIFSGQIASYLIRSIIQTIEVAWFAPVLWPSVAVLSVSQGNVLNSVIFGVLSVAFTATLFGAAVALRNRFWVPIPVSIKFSNRTYQPRSGLRFPGIGVGESAILAKDFKSLIRRREMARFLAIPFVLAVSMGFSMFPARGELGSEAVILQTFVFIIPLVIFSQLLAMTSIGQEGRAIWNLYTAPLKPETILKAKFLLATMLGTVFCIAMVAILWVIFRTTANVPFFVIIGIGIVLEQASIGMLIGSRFPDFRETVRSRYVSFWGSLIGIGAGLGISAGPLLLLLILNVSLVYGSALSFVIALIVTVMGLRAARGAMRRLLRNMMT